MPCFIFGKCLDKCRKRKSQTDLHTLTPLISVETNKKQILRRNTKSKYF